MKVLPMKLGNDDIIWANSIKYLGVTILAGVKMCVDLEVVQRKFYAACNSIICTSINLSRVA
jgi:hypothetical protein